MTLDSLTQAAQPLPANVAAQRLLTDAAHWRASAQRLHELGASLLTLWGSDDRDRDGVFRIFAVYLLPNRLLLLEHALPAGTRVYPALNRWFPVAAGLQRAVYDLLGIEADSGDTRPWLRHDGWAADYFPLRRDAATDSTGPLITQPYPFVPVTGDGVHEIAVGPVHAGTIEPGHFRFSVVGEKILRLEARLGYTHKGIAKRFEMLPLLEGHQLAARLCGDSSVAYSWAYCAALEAISDAQLPRHASALRALALERERLANHLGDLGALGNDAGLAFGLMQFSSLKEQLLRLNQQAFGQRYLFDYVIPGGVLGTPGPRMVRALLDQTVLLEQAVPALRAVYDNHAGLQDRFRTTGQLSPAVAKAHGALGLVARASGIAQDLRLDLPWPPYDQLKPVCAVQAKGDVAARVQLRFDEVMQSLQLSRTLLETLPAGPSVVSIPSAPPGRLGLGVIEGWRGPLLIALETAADNRVRRCHAHDPSWQNWPLVEYAILGNIVPDFPLINKSFNLAYSGHDG